MTLFNTENISNTAHLSLQTAIKPGMFLFCFVFVLGWDRVNKQNWHDFFLHGLPRYNYSFNFISLMIYKSDLFIKKVINSNFYKILAKQK